jgi:hypothetical protein
LVLVIILTQALHQVTLPKCLPDPWASFSWPETAPCVSSAVRTLWLQVLFLELFGWLNCVFFPGTPSFLFHFQFPSHPYSHLHPSPGFKLK